MYVCLCNAVTESDIRRAVRDEGVRTLAQLKERTGCSSNCGSCEVMARELLSEALHEQRAFLSVVSDTAA
jgi:bacterioferritin-associated ferredoxin